MNVVVPSPCETDPYNKVDYDWLGFSQNFVPLQATFILVKLMVWTQEYQYYNSYFVIIQERLVLKGTVVSGWCLTTWAEVIIRVKWLVFVSQRCYKSGPLKASGQFSHSCIGWKTLVKFVYHSLTGFNPSIIYQPNGSVWSSSIDGQIKALW